MQKRLLLLLILILYATRGFSSVAPSNKFTYGINWHQIVLTEKFMNMNFNAWHSGIDGNDSTTRALNAIWFDTVSGTPIVMQDSITTFADAERMKYSVLKKPFDTTHAKDTLSNFYFLQRDTIVGRRSETQWKILADSTSHFQEVKILWNNEFPGSWRHWNKQYDTLFRPLKIAVRIRVTGLATSGAEGDTLLRFVLKVGSNVLDSSVLHWGDVHTDTGFVVWFSDWIHAYGSQWLFPQSFDSGALGLNLEVYSHRHTTMYLDWVCLEDNLAHSFLAAKDLDPGDDTLIRLRQHVDSVLTRDYLYLDTLRNDKPFYVYRHDEPFYADFDAHKYIDSLMHYRGITEIGRPCAERYVEQFPGSILWVQMPPIGYWQRCSYVDKSYWDLDGEWRSSHTGDPPLDSMLKWRRHTYSSQYGYIPDGRTQQEMAMSKDSSTRHPFDVFDALRGGNIVTVGDYWKYAKHFDSLVYFGGAAHAPTEWWAHHLEVPNLIFDTLITDTPSVVAYWRDHAPTVGEQFTLENNLAFGLGAKGTFIMQGAMASCDQCAECGGLVDQAGEGLTDWWVHTPNADGPDSFPLPAMFERRGTAAKEYGAWLRDYASTLKPTLFKGSWIRILKEMPGNEDSMIAFVDTMGVLPPVAFDKDLEVRPILSAWVSTNDSIQFRITRDTLAKKLRWVMYSWFKDTSGTGNMFLEVINPWCDPRNLRCEFPHSPDNAYVKRGTRTIYTTFRLDSIESKWWKVTRIDTSSPVETIIAYNGVIHAEYAPGAAHIFRISKYCDYADRNPIDSGGVAINNSVRMARHGSDLRAVYIRNGSVWTRKMNDCTVEGEKLVELGGLNCDPKEIVMTCNTPPPYPSGIGGPPPPGPSDHTTTHYVQNRSACLAQHRGAASDEDLIVWEQNVWDTTTYTSGPDSGMQFHSYHKMILGRPISFSSDAFLTAFPFVLNRGSSNLQQHPNLWTYPTICATDSGFIVAWGDSTPFIHTAVIQGSRGNYLHDNVGANVSFDSVHGPAMFPSIAWGNNLAAIGCYAPLVQMVWSQPIASGHRHIFHQVLEVKDTVGCPSITTIPVFYPPEQVSIFDPWCCDNTHPTITVDASGSGSVLNVAYIM